jgi:hypothetical protein
VRLVRTGRQADLLSLSLSISSVDWPGAFAGSPPLILVLPKFLHYIRAVPGPEISQSSFSLQDFKLGNQLLFYNYQGKPSFLLLI